MASQTDKKEEFRKYLEKSNVLATLTNILTDLFEMDVKPEDPGQYLYQKFGESLKKSAAPPSQPNNDQRDTTQRDTAMTDITPNATAEVGVSATKPNHGLAPSTFASSKPDAMQSVSATVPAETEAVKTQTTQSAQPQPQVEPSVPATASETLAPNTRESTIVVNETNSIDGSAQPNTSVSQAQPSSTAIPTGSLGSSGGVQVANNATGPSPAPAPAQ